MNPAWLLALLIAIPAGSAAAPIVLAAGGRSSYSIVIARDASPSERRGAAELQRFFEEMSGARLPIVTDAERPKGRMLLVGRSRALERLRLRISYDSLGPEGFLLRTAGRNLVIAGGRQRGTMYGVYTFLEKLGCRWFSRDVSRIPKLATLTVPDLNETQKPAFEYREPFFTEAFDKDWAARNKTNGDHSELDESTGGKIQYFPFVHSFYRLVPPEKYFKDHPEYFSLIDGRRRVERGQLCLTNPDVLRIGIESVLQWIRERPEATIYSVSQNDWTGWCECGNCRRVEEEEGGAHSGPLLRFVNALAAEIEKKHPHKLIDTLAYWYTETPPLKARPRPNVRIRLCPIGACEAHPYEQCERNAYFIRNLQAWSRITSQLYIWHYNTNFSHYLLPFPDFDELAADIPMYRRYGVVGLFLQGAYAKGGGGENAELRSYMMARLLWDSGADANKAVDEFLEAFYGRAVRTMRAYFDLLHEQVRRPPRGSGHHLYIFMHPGAPHLSADLLKAAGELFRKAEAEAEDEGVRQRVRKARLPVDYVALSHSKRFEVRGDVYAPPDLGGLRERFAAFLGEVRRFGILSLHEGRGLEDDEKEFAARIRPYPVVTLENDALRVDVAAELSGRSLRILDRRSGTNVLREADPGERGYPDLAGLGVFVYPDYHGRPWEAAWRVEAARPNQVILAGTCPNGVRLRRTLRLPDREPVLHTETVVENGGNSPVSLAMQSRAEFSAGLPSDARLALAFRAADGTEVNRTLFTPGDETTGSATYMAAQCPDGEWRALHRAGGLALVNRFPKQQVARCAASWSVRGDNRMTLVLWSPAKELAPGETMTLEAGYGVELVAPSRP